MFAKRVYDVQPLFSEPELKLDGYTVLKNGAGYLLKNKNKFNLLKPDIQVIFDGVNSKVTITANSFPKLFAWAGVVWMLAMLCLFAVLIITGEFSYAIKFWFGVIVGMWIVIPVTVVALCIVFRKNTKRIFEDIHSQLK